MIYAINKRTKEHRIAKTGQAWDADEWDLVCTNADGWIEHDGGECPLPDGALCEVLMECKETRTALAGSLWWGVDVGGAGAITAYRPILDAEPKAPEWGGGLPPVGCECECYYKGAPQGVVTVRYVGSEMCVLLNHEHGEEQCGRIDAYRFEPILTHAQRAGGEAVEAIEQQAISLSKPLCKKLYIAIRDGKVPGVRLDN